jgi:excisionase family DNA binding protein
MMQLTLGQAARQTGKSKSTLTRAIKSGRLSATRSDDGSYLIDPAELFRVWPATGSGTPSTQPPREPDTTPDDSLVVLQVRLEAAQAALDRERELNGDLTRRLDRAEERVLQLTHRDVVGQQPRGLLRWLWTR